MNGDAPPRPGESSDGLFDGLRERYSDDGVRGRVFERLVQYAFERHPGEYGPQRFRNVWRWAEWPGRATHGYGPDVGIDLVAEQTELWGGGLCAIQTKFYGETSRIAKSDVDSFLSASSTSWFTHRILVVTAPLTSNAETMVLKASPRCEVVQRPDLEEWPVSWPDFFETPEHLSFRSTRCAPYPFQATAVEKVVAGFVESDRGKLILPCGTGKSVVALWIAERLAGRGGRVMLLVPSIALMGQIMREWARRRSPDVPHRYVGICSDTRAGRADEDADMVELAMPVTTDIERITEQLSQPVDDEMTTVFCTYQSLELVAQAQRAGAPGFDLVICDEAHRTTGVQEASRATAFTLVHDPDEISADKRLYMTATPRLYTSRLKAKADEHVRDFDVYSMDDEEVYGPEFYRMGFGDAVEGGYLTDYQVLVIAVAEDPVIEQFDYIEAGDDREPINAGEAVRLTGCWDALADPTTRSAAGRVTGAVNPEVAARRAIAFTNTIRNSQRLQKYWRPVMDSMAARNAAGVELLDCAVRHVDGRDNAFKRKTTIDWLQGTADGGGCRIVTNAKCLTEGVDVPALDAVLFIEPKRSQIDVVQAVGRVMRRSEAKKYGYVVLPVVVPSGASLADDKVLSGSDFKQVWDVLKALRSHDERLDVAINTADLGGTVPLRIITSGLCDQCTRADCDGGEACAARISVRDAVQGRLPFENAIASKLVEVCGDRQYWDRWGREVAAITERIITRVRIVLDSDEVLSEAFGRFGDAMRATVGEHLTRPVLVTMLAQHVVTMPVFDVLFSGSGFADRNPISKALNELLDEFKSGDVRLRDETRDLDRFYSSVANRLAGTTDSDARLDVMLDVYETFFAEAMPADVKRLGIVYTPPPLVDFVLRSADAVLRKEFGRRLTDRGVHVLDPFTGTGTFVNRLLTQKSAGGGAWKTSSCARRTSPASSVAWTARCRRSMPTRSCCSPTTSRPSRSRRATGSAPATTSRSRGSSSPTRS